MAALLRTLIVTIALGGVIGLIFWRVGMDHRQRTIDELNALNAEMQQKLEQRQAMIERLSRSRRVAHVEITAQRLAEDDSIFETDVLFIEVNDDGRELARQTFTIAGHVLFIDAWTVKFDAEHVADGHPLYGRSLVLLRRIYSDQIAPAAGELIDTPGAVPPGYAGSDISRFEQRIWTNFWPLATDWRLAREMGIRVAQGEAVYKPVKAGQRYELIVDAVGGMSLTPLPLDESHLTRVP